MMYQASEISMAPAGGELPLQPRGQINTTNFQLADGRELGGNPEAGRSSIRRVSKKRPLPKLVHYKWWLRITAYIIFILVGQSAAVLLGRLYFDEGGNSKWMATFVQSAGFPVLVPLLYFFRNKKASADSNTSLATLLGLYLFFGVLLAGDNLMYSYGIVYVPVSTYSLLCATQLAFNAVFAYFINGQKFTPFIINSLVLLTISAALLAFQSDTESLPGISRGQYILGFTLTLAASATYSLYLSLVQVSFQKVIKRETFVTVLEMLFYPAFITTCVCTLGLFASGEWRGLSKEMKGYKKGAVSYVMTLLWTALSWQLFSVGLLGLVFEVSSLFSNVIGTLGLPVVPVLAVVFFKDKMDGTKVLLLAVWGFTSYIYQHYLDDTKLSANATSTDATCGGNQVVVESC
ncbi:hypothetical protein QQ045_014587 [Rhodiola kirilowii]